MNIIWKPRRSLRRLLNAWRAVTKPILQEEQVMQSLQSYRKALERRRDHYLGAWRWSLWPLMPGIAVAVGGSPLFDPRPHEWPRLAASAAVCAASLCLALWNYRHKGAQLQKELDALNTLDENTQASDSRA